MGWSYHLFRCVQCQVEIDHKSACYVTETAVTKYATVYYQRSVWDKLTKPHFERLGETLMEKVPDVRVTIVKLTVRMLYSLQRTAFWACPMLD
jgi:hypothetical protein